MRVLIATLLLTSAMPLAAQSHAGHGTHAGHATTTQKTAKKDEATDPHAGHAMPAAQQPDPHAGHAMPAAPPADPHAGHASSKTPDADRHADHTMPEAPAPDPHVGHTMSAASHPDPHAGHQTATAPQADPHAGHDMIGASASQHDHAAMGHGVAPVADEPPPPRAYEGPRHAADAYWGEQAMQEARDQLAREHGAMKTGMIMVERLEARIRDGSDAYLWDAQGWYGGDLIRAVVKTEGEGEFGHGVEDAEVQLLYSRAIGPFFDLQAGARLDLEPETRSHLALGVQGLAPYMFHVDGTLFLSDRGDLTGRFEGEYDQKITQSLILQPRVEFEFAAQDISEREIGAGLTKLEAGLRLRYEIVPEFAPYIGIEYEAKLGETADIARARGDDPSGFALLLGLRAWF